MLLIGSHCVNKQSLDLHLTKTQTFSNSLAFREIKKYGNGTAVLTEIVFRSVYHVACGGSSETGLFRDLSNHDLSNLQKSISY